MTDYIIRELDEDSDSDKIFTVKSCPISKIFCVNNRAYRIPLYQRAYSWDKENIEQLFDDILLGVSKQRDNINDKKEKTVTYAGTILLVKKEDQELDDVAEYNIVDGQQRSTTFLLISTILYKELESIKSASLNDRLSHLVKKVKKLLFKFFLIIDEAVLDSPIPRLMIIGKDEIFDKDGKASYLSPIAKYLYDFHQSCINSTPKSIDIKDEKIRKNCETITSLLNEYINPKKKF